MFTHYRTEGVILKKIDRGEADQLLVAYTKDFGRLEIIAKGIRKIGSKLRPAVDFPAVVELEFIQGKTCKTLTDALILIPLKQMRGDPRKRDAACRITGMAEALVKDQQPDIRVWELVKSTLVAGNASAARDTDAICQYFAWHLFNELGWRPEFGESSVGIACRSLVRFFRDSGIDQSARMRLTARQVEELDEVAGNYLELVTK
jgi:DNA repair protein RecO (recombination protein O)